MSLTSIGDLAQSYMMRRQNTALKAQMNQLVQELSSGKTADIARHLSGSYAYLSDIDRNLTLNRAYEDATSEAALFSDGMQAALENFQTVSEGLGLAALSSGSANLAEAVHATTTRAVSDFGLLVTTLNSDQAGRALFAGETVDSAALASGADILADLRTELAGETTLAGVQAKLDAWFEDPGGGFETTAYLGSAEDLPPLRLGEGETVDLGLRADDPALRVLLKHAAMAALAGDSALSFDIDLQKQMLSAAGEGLTFDQVGLTQIRADLGYVQSRAEEASTRLSAERTSYEIARTGLLEADPYETASRLEDVQFQLEALYAVTARMARLSLTSYL